jgi:serine/threonine protein kinase
MDMFSLGCAIMDVLLNGKPMMSFENLLQFRKGEFSLQPIIQSATEGLPNSEVLRSLLSSMLERDPEKRPTIEELFHRWLEFSSKDVSLLVWYLQNAFCKSCFFTPDLRIGLLRRVIERI